MGDVSPAPRDVSPVSAADDRLDSWKEIASYLKRDVSTVQRWEKKEGLPVHRLPHDKLGSVFAFKPELDAWWNRGRQRIEAAETSPRWERTRDTLLDWRSPLANAFRASAAALRSSWKSALALGLALLAAFAAGGAVIWQVARSRMSAPRPVVRSVIPLAPAESVVNGIAISPDGRWVAYGGRHEGQWNIYVRALDESASRLIPGTEGGHEPFFSPDGQWVGFFNDERNEMRKVALSGGAPVTICEAGTGHRGASWGADGTIVFTPTTGGPAGDGGLRAVSNTRGIVQVLTRPDADRREKTHRWPHVLPSGKAVLFTSGTADISSFDDAAIEVLTFESGERKVLMKGGAYARYISTGHLVYARAGALIAAPFNIGRLEITGPPVAVLDGVATRPERGDAAFDVSDNGTLVYAAGGPHVRAAAQLVWVDRGGRIDPITPEPRAFSVPRVSPDGRRIAVVVDAANQRVWVYDIGRGTLMQLPASWDMRDPAWTPDGSRITAVVEGRGLSWQPADGSGPPQMFGDSVGGNPLSWSPDGKMLTLARRGEGMRYDTWLFRPSDGEPKLKPLLHGKANEHSAVFSPDGRWLAYVSDESGRDEIYVQPIDSPAKRWQISTAGGLEPVWARDGRELFYRHETKMMAVQVRLGPAFTASVPTVLFAGDFVMGGEGSPGRTAFDVMPDGRRFVMIKRVPSPSVTELHLVQDWFEELKRKVPAGR